jgi:aspartate-semialdehyde dehydrogenase
MTAKAARRVVVFGATGHLGQALIERLEASPLPIAEITGVATEESLGLEFGFRGESFEVVSDWPVLKGRDLVFVCTPSSQALEIVREALRAEVPCIDCTGVVSDQEGVVLARSGAADPSAEALAKAPLVAVPSGTALAWAPLLEALPVERVVATVLASASASGRAGVVALSEESIALFNQQTSPQTGPAGQAVAFDVIPGGGIDCARVAGELRRLFGEALRVSVTSAQVPTFAGEGASLALDLAEPLDLDAVLARLRAAPGLELVAEGPGARGLELVEAAPTADPIGPTLRDVVDRDAVLVGRIEADPSRPEGQGWRLWVAFDPLRLVADEATRLAERRLGTT